MNSQDFNQIISEKYGQFTKGEKQIANYLRRNQDESAFLSIGELAERLGLSEATLVRFARTLGFSSYPAMRTVLQDAFRRRVTHSARLRGRLEDLRQGGDIFEKLVVSEMDYLTQALETVDRGALQKTVELLRTCERIFVFGGGPSISLVDLMDIRLRRMGKDVVALKSSGREVLESLLSLTPNDLLFAICFFDLNPTLQLVLDYANEIGCPIIILTDTLESIIGQKANVSLAARRCPISEFHSLVVPMTVINTMLLGLVNEDEKRVAENLEKLDQLRERLRESSRNFPLP